MKRFKFSLNKDGELNPGFYPRDLLVAIIDGIAKETGEDGSNVWQRFEKGLFAGSMMHLRDIERIYGPKSLKMLSKVELPDDDEVDTPRKKAYDKVLKFFQGENKK